MSSGDDSSDSVRILSDENKDDVPVFLKKSEMCRKRKIDVITLSEDSDESVSSWPMEIHEKRRKELPNGNATIVKTVSGENSQSVKTKGAIFLSPCSTCEEPSKYRCPKCCRPSCSLDCVKAHKEKHNCDGKRDPKAFLPVTEFKESNLRSDFHFMEEMNRVIDNAERARFSQGMMHKLPHNLFKLQQAARNRKTDLHILPISFGKRKMSTTYFRYSDAKIFWRVEWKFPLCDFTCSDDRIDEEEILVKCLDKYMWSNQEELTYYRSFGHNGVSVLIQDLYCPANVTKYHVLRKNKSLRSNFEGKKILEFPTLLVVPNIHLSAYVDENV